MRAFDGNKLRTIREKQHKSQKELAKAIGVKQVVVSTWELNRKKPSEHYQKMMAKFLFVGTFEFHEEESKIVVHSEPNGKRERTPFNYTLFKHLRIKKGLSPADIASMIGCDASTILNWERGENPARISLQEKAAEVLSVPLALLSCKDGSVTPEEYDSAFGVRLELPIEEPKKPSKPASVIENLQDYVLVTKEAYQALLEDQERLHQVQETIGGWLHAK